MNAGQALARTPPAKASQPQRSHTVARRPGPVATAWRPMVQAKLRVGAVDDPLEREADRAADAVMGGAGAGALTPAIIPAAQRKCAACEAEDEAPIQRKCAACGRESAMAPARAETAAAAVSHRGAPLSRDLRAYFEPRFGRDLSDVRVHTHPTGAEAARGIGAKAYTLGPDIAFATGEYAPGTSAGRHLIARTRARGTADPGDNTPGAAGYGRGRRPPGHRQPRDCRSRGDAGQAVPGLRQDVQGWREGPLVQDRFGRARP
jgi:hypothetical protein